MDEIEDEEPQYRGEYYRTKSLDYTPQTHAWIAKNLEDRLAIRRAQGTQLIETEVNARCPPRKVSDFRVIVIRDARESAKYSIKRTAQLTMWNVLSLGDGFLVEGKRYMVRGDCNLRLLFALRGTDTPG